MHTLKAFKISYETFWFVKMRFLRTSCYTYVDLVKLITCCALELYWELKQWRQSSNTKGLF